MAPRAIVPRKFGSDKSKFTWDFLLEDKRGQVFIDNVKLDVGAVPVLKAIFPNMFMKREDGRYDIPYACIALIDEYRSKKEQTLDQIRAQARALAERMKASSERLRITEKAYMAYNMISLGFLMRGEIIWDKAASAGTSTAWGSWCSASNPTLRDVHEYILVFSKGTFSRQKKSESGEKTDTISKEQFLEYTKSIWSFPTESAKKIGHPAPFPVELPSRAIQFYSFQGDIVLDPFMGSGQTAIAAIKAKRHFVGYDISAEYKDLADKRIKRCMVDMNSPTLLDFQEKSETPHDHPE